MLDYFESIHLFYPILTL